MCVQHDYRNKWTWNINKACIMQMIEDLECRFDGRKCSSDRWWNNDKCQCGGEKTHVCKKILFEILLYVIVKMENI